MGNTARARSGVQPAHCRAPDISLQQQAELRQRAGATQSKDPGMLQQEGSPLDLMLRGFSQADVLGRTGVDIGYHGSALRISAKEIDRFEYKVEHVRVRVDKTVVLAALAAHAEGLSKIGTLRVLGLSGYNIVTLRRLFGALGLAEEFGAADKAFRRGHMAEGMLAAYGVANPFKSDKFQKAAEQTRLERYSGKYTFSKGSSLAEAARATFAQHMSDRDFAEDRRRRKTTATRARFGVAYPSQSLLVQAKMRATSRLRYGVDHPSQRSEARARQSAVVRLDGARRASISRQTNLARYGVEHISQLPANRDRQSELMTRTFTERGRKARATTLKRYGVLYAAQRQERRMALAAFMRTNGVEFAARSRVTSLARYGVASHAQTEQRRMSQSLRMLDPEHQKRITAAKHANNSFRTSAAEEALYVALVRHFGEHDVLREHVDPRYPYRCDFFIPSRDLFVELNGMWTHGGHWFDQTDLRDLQVIRNWQARNTAYCMAAVTEWCQRDKTKRDAAGAAELNYVTFWDSQRLSDAQLWLAMGAPDGCDWKHEYSWLPVRKITPAGDLTELVQQSPTVAPATAARSQTDPYRREMKIWEANRGTRWGTVQAVLYSERYRVLGKLPQELSVLEILQGLSGIPLLGEPSTGHS